jgi:tripartite-type tricarboxylate transporter receptor subunit TctC
MTAIRRFLPSLVVMALGSLASFVSAQSYPTKPLTMVVPSAAGSGNDITARRFGSAFQEELKQTIVVENRPGVGAALGVTTVAKAPPDGYTWLFLGGDSASPVFGKQIPYILDELTPVIQLTRGAFFLITSTAIPAANVEEFVRIVKANPGKYNYASAATTQMIAMEVVKQKAGLDLVHVPYKGIAQVNSAFMQGEIIAFLSIATGLESAIAQKKVRFLAYLDGERNPLYPDVPSAPEVGLGGVTSRYSQAVWVPKGTSAALISRLNASFNNVLKRPDIQEFVRAQGSQISGGTPEAHAESIRVAYAFWAEAARIAKFVPD